jgi:hypothetical protein
MQDELTLKELVLAVQEYFYFFLSKWYWFVLGGLIVGGGFCYYAYSTPSVYTAPLTFMLNDEKEASIGAGAILGSLGLGGGGKGGGGSKVNKLLELGKSRKVLSRVLFDSVAINGNRKLLADHIIDIYGYHDNWQDSELLKGFYFGDGIPAPDDPVGNNAFKQLYNKLVTDDEGLLELEVDEFSGLFDLRANTLHPELSVALATGTYARLSEYFITASVSGKEETLAQLEERADSVKIELAKAEGVLARFEDRSSQVLLRKNTIRGQELNRTVLILSTMYAEILKNKETAAFLLANEKPAFNLIDAPLEPLAQTKESRIFALIIGGLLGVILTGIILFFTKLVRDAMAS